MFGILPDQIFRGINIFSILSNKEYIIIYIYKCIYIYYSIITLRLLYFTTNCLIIKQYLTTNYIFFLSFLIFVVRPEIKTQRRSGCCRLTTLTSGFTPDRGFNCLIILLIVLRHVLLHNYC